MNEQILQQILDKLTEIKNDFNEMKYKQKHLSVDIEFINNTYRKKLSKHYEYYDNYKEFPR